MRSGVFLAVLLAVGGCSRSEGPSADPQAAPLPAAKAEEPATLRGMVLWTGAMLADPDPFIETNDPNLRAAWGRGFPPDERFAVAADGGLPHALVWAASGPHTSRQWPAPAEPFELRIHAAMFVPHVFGVRVGQPVRVSTDDERTYSPRVVRLKSGGTAAAFVTRGQTAQLGSIAHFHVRIVDDVYSWMEAHARAFDHPFFATTDASGRFEIRDLPPGDYVFKAWHERMTADSSGHEAKSRITLASGASASVDFELR